MGARERTDPLRRLAHWLDDQVRETERLALQAQSTFPGPWRYERGEVRHSGSNTLTEPQVCNTEDNVADRHIAENDPLRIMRWTAAVKHTTKTYRLLLYFYEVEHPANQPARWDQVRIYTNVVADFASVYSDHNGYESVKL